MPRRPIIALAIALAALAAFISLERWGGVRRAPGGEFFHHDLLFSLRLPPGCQGWARSEEAFISCSSDERFHRSGSVRWEHDEGELKDREPREVQLGAVKARYAELPDQREWWVTNRRGELLHFVFSRTAVLKSSLFSATAPMLDEQVMQTLVLHEPAPPSAGASYDYSGTLFDVRGGCQPRPDQPCEEKPRPLAGSAISVRRLEGDRPATEDAAQGRSAADGSFKLSLLPGRYALFVAVGDEPQPRRAATFRIIDHALQEDVRFRDDGR
ncbi:MAG: hypothetical protein IPJ65_08310 [Archangiaceae bacterium]|nr:hypothetical protein [Archangiaceae bacterium]